MRKVWYRATPAKPCNVCLKLSRDLPALSSLRITGNTPSPVRSQRNSQRQLFSTSKLRELWIAAGKKPEDFGNARQRERNRARTAKSVARREEAMGGGVQAIGEQIREVEQEIEAEDAELVDVKEVAAWESTLPTRGEKQ